MTIPHYDPPGSYTQHIPNGVAAFRKVVADHWHYSRTEVIRDQSRCAQTNSEHCVCRAIDFFTTDITKGRELFEWCIRVADGLGVQSVIFNRRVWGFGNWSERAYTGPSPHTDHVHVGINKQGAATNTEALVWSYILGGGGNNVGDLSGTELGRQQAKELSNINQNVSDIEGGLNAANTKLDRLVANPPGSVTITPADRHAIAVEVADLLAERLKP